MVDQRGGEGGYGSAYRAHGTSVTKRGPSRPMAAASAETGQVRIDQKHLEKYLLTKVSEKTHISSRKIKNTLDTLQGVHELATSTRNEIMFRLAERVTEKSFKSYSNVVKRALQAYQISTGDLGAIYDALTELNEIYNFVDTEGTGDITDQLPDSLKRDIIRNLRLE